MKFRLITKCIYDIFVFTFTKIAPYGNLLKVYQIVNPMSRIDFITVHYIDSTASEYGCYYVTETPDEIMKMIR